MAENVITTVFKADISNFSSETQDLNRYISTVNSEFKNAVAGLDNWASTQDGLTAKITQLNKILEAEKGKLENLENAYAEMVAAGKENTAEAQKLAIAINNQRAKVAATEKDIGKYTDSLNELQEAGADTREELEKLNREQEELKANAQELGNKTLVGAGVGLAGLASACVGAIAGLSGLVENTKELRTQMGQLETSFELANLGAENAESTFKTLYGVLGDNGKATEASLHLAQIAKDEKELAEYTDILTGVYARYGDTLPVEALAEAVNHSSELGSVQGVLADAIEWSGGNVDEFNAKLESLNTEEERAALIKSTLNGIYGESSEKYKEVNADVIAANEAQAEYNATMAGLAEKVEPAMTQFKTSMVGVLQSVFDKFSEADIEGLIGGISEGVSTLTNDFLPPLLSSVEWVLKNLDWLVPLLGSVVGLVAGISAGIKIYNGVVAAAKVAQMAWNLAMSANPIGLIVAAVALLVAGFVLLWNKCEGFRNFFKGFVNVIIDGVNAIIKGINKINFDIPDWVPVIGGGKFGFNIPLIPKLAKGGVVDRATLAMIGEQGREAVVPLENNTEWIDELARKLNRPRNDPPPRYVTVNQTFKGIESTRYALHKAKVEMMNAIKLSEA